jgi:hypothetical protein
MSVLLPIATEERTSRKVRKVPTADKYIASNGLVYGLAMR